MLENLLYEAVVWLRDYEAWVEDIMDAPFELGSFHIIKRKENHRDMVTPFGWEELRLRLRQP